MYSKVYFRVHNIRTYFAINSSNTSFVTQKKSNESRDLNKYRRSSKLTINSIIRFRVD